MKDILGMNVDLILLFASSDALESATRGDHLAVLDLLEVYHAKFII